MLRTMPQEEMQSSEVQQALVMEKMLLISSHWLMEGLTPRATQKWNRALRIEDGVRVQEVTTPTSK